MRFRRAILCLGLGLMTAAWFGARAVEVRRFRRELGRARQEFEARRFGAARARLVQLAGWRPSDGEVGLLLGACERARGHPGAALEAWGRVPDAAEQAPLASLWRGRLALEVGRYRLAESCLLRATRAGGGLADEASGLLEWLYWMTGRRDENRAILRARAGRMDDPSPVLLVLWDVDHDPYPVALGAEAGRFVEVSDRAGPAWTVPRVGRGLAVGDVDNDGRADVLIVAQDGPLALLRNRGGPAGHFVTIALEGVASNRDAVGARVAVTAGGRTRVSWRFGGGSYLSSGDPRLHFGLGAARTVDRIEVSWPSGRRDVHEGLAADAGYRLREGDPGARPLAGFTRPRDRP